MNQPKVNQMKNRKWCITINNYVEEDINNFVSVSKKNWKYIFGFEIGKVNNTKHLQGFVYYENCIRLSALKKLWPRGHFIKSDGSIDQNIKYCSKEGDYKSNWTEEEIRAAIKRVSDDIKPVDPYILKIRRYIKIEHLMMKETDINHKLNCEYCTVSEG